LRGGAIVSSTGGNITINGTGSTISGSEGIGIGVFGAGTGKVEINAPTRSVSLIADTIDVDPTLGTVAAGTGTVTLRQKNPGRRINLGAADSATVLGLTDAELDRITAGTVVVGNSNSGAITISGVLSPASFRALDIRRGVDFSPTGGFASDVTSATVFESIKVNGDTTIDSSATLAVTATGGFTVAAGDTFTILDNSSVGLTTGNFSGKPAGTVIVLNGTQKALTYLGGTGNDVVLDTLSAATDSDRNGFSDFEEAAVAAQPSHFTVGETITSIDLSSIVLQGLEKLVVAGLPSGLELNPANNHIEGTIKGELGAAGVEIRKVLGRRIVSSLSFGMSVAPYPLLGGYEALLERDGLPVGRAKLLFTAAGSFSATLELLGEAPRSAKGPFPITAATTQTVPVFFREGTGGVPASTQVLFHLDSTSDQFTGEHVGDTVRGFRLVKPDRSQPQRMTCEFHTPGDRVNTPGGHGFGTGALNANGLLSVSGSLGDGQPFTLALNLSQTNQAVIFLQPYAVKSTSFFGGIMELPGLFAPERGGSGQTQPPGAGLLWKKAEMANATSYRNGFGPLSVSSSLSKWFPSITAEGLALSLDLKLRQIEATYDVPPAGVLPSRFELRNAFTLIRSLPTNSVPWKGQAVASNGTFSGTLTLPVPAAKTSVTGVFLQDLSFGNQIGTGLIKIPIADVGLPKGSFETAGVTLSHN
jgi:hypothetical protein